jgi:hypothetical protein
MLVLLIKDICQCSIIIHVLIITISFRHLVRIQDLGQIQVLT